MITCTPNALAEAAACFTNIEGATLDAVQSYLVCQIAGGGGGGGGGGFLTDDGSTPLSNDGSDNLIP